MLKSDTGRDLVSAIEALQKDQTFFTSNVAEMVLENYLRSKPELSPSSKNQLTPREREIVQLLKEKAPRKSPWPSD